MTYDEIVNNPDFFRPSQIVKAYNARFGTDHGLWKQPTGALELMRIALKTGKPVDIPDITVPPGADL